MIKVIFKEKELIIVAVQRVDNLIQMLLQLFRHKAGLDQRDDNEKGRRKVKKLYKARFRRISPLVECKIRGRSF